MRICKDYVVSEIQKIMVVGKNDLYSRESYRSTNCIERKKLTSNILFVIWTTEILLRLDGPDGGKRESAAFLSQSLVR